MDKLKAKLGIDESLTKGVKKPKEYTKFKDRLPQREDFNFLSDLLELPEHKGYRYLLVVVDLITDEFDIEPLKSKEPSAVLAAFKKMIKRKHINLPYASLATDGGSEFKGVFHKYLYDQSILHKTSLPGRKTQMANVERLNGVLGKLFNGYMNKKEMETGRVFKDWVSIVPLVREELNKIRKKEPDPNKIPVIHDATAKPVFKVGDVVHRQLDQPRNALNEKVSGGFREGDLRFDPTPRKVTEVLEYPGKVPFRYMLSGITNASFTAQQLKSSKETTEKFEIKKLLDKKKIKGKIHYLVWWKGYPKKQATFEPRSILIKDAPEIVRAFEEELKKKK